MVAAAYPSASAEFVQRWSRARRVSLPGCTQMCASEQPLLVQGQRGSGPHICIQLMHKRRYIVQTRLKINNT